MRTHKPWLPIPAASALSLALTACGGDTNDGPAPASMPATETVDPVEDEAVDDPSSGDDDAVTGDDVDPDDGQDATPVEDEMEDEVEAGSSAGSREDPYAVGDTIELGDWTWWSTP